MINLLFVSVLIILALSTCPLNEIEGTEYVLTGNEVCEYTESVIITSSKLQIKTGSTLKTKKIWNFTCNATGNSIINTNQLELSSSTIDLEDTSIINTNQLELSSNSKINLSGNSMLNSVGNVIFVTSLFKLSENARLSVKGNISLSGGTSPNKLSGKSRLSCHSLNSKTVGNRTIKDLPLFFVSNTVTITGFSGFTHDCDFDFLFTNNTLNESLYTTPFKVLLEGHLLRYGASDEIYCHVNHTEDTPYPYYIENYCPLTDAYITPIDTFYQMKVKVDAPKQSLNVKSTENEENVIVIGNQKYDLSLTEFIEIEMISDNQVVLNNIMITKNVFLVAVNGFEYNNTSCKSGYFQNGIFICQNHIPCTEGGKTTDGRCVACQVANCVTCDGDKGNCIKCKENLTYNTNTNMCEEYTNCLSFTKDKCLRCNDGFVFEGNNCVKITEGNGNCQIKVSVPSECLLCDLTNMTLINSNGVCSVVDSNVAVHSLSNVVECKNGFYVQNNMCNNCTTNNNGKNGKCAPQIDNCIKYVNVMCVECSFEYSYDGNVSCVEPSKVNVSCGMATPVGCIRCDGNTFLNVSTHKCEACNSNCESCLNSTKCLSCVDGYFLSDHICKSNDALNDTCARKVPNGNGCLECKVGYYKKGTDCVLCDVKCGECMTENSCIKCNATNYKTSNGDCLPRSSISTCAVEVTESGCSTCKNGYYTVNGNECQKCVERCAKCSEPTRCTSCDDTYVLKSTSCVSYNTITKCTKTKDSKCSSYTFWYSPSDDGTYCSKTAVWWVILLIIVIVISILVLVIVSVSFVMVKVIKHKRDTSNFTLFKLKHTNMTFVEMANGLIIHTKNKGFLITDDDQDYDEIDVNKQIKNLFSIGNTTNHKVKIQFTSKNDIEKYTIRFEPSIVTIPPKFACEFSLFLSPLCTSTIDSTFVVSYLFTTSDSTTCAYHVNFKYTTKLSTRLDPDELIEEKQLGEGSFGIVFKGFFRGNIVAIKKMKNLVNSSHQMEEFENEVLMLDKFRSEYIVYFYGAVFIPNKICMVTEFAQYGSLQDLMKNKKGEVIKIKLRVKFMFDAAKGILYLHENGMLHRDIKPDNILMLSLNLNGNVNAKLTDFGSARNVNLLMTNMTFTKGIGTPIYMAPEVLKQEKYTKSADVYSFAITMFECFSWKDAYPITTFKFPWKIAEFVSSGKRPDISDTIPIVLNELIQKCWVQKQKERLDIHHIKEQLQSLFI
ncbi:protein serine/threonine kinase, putative [Entamoeba invadens IP1]|uniref:Protein serine/threonine kinase, putative n=1 Tax=Entamoeba invadens IP1 TaxID=370355 RepID=A0A0A1UGV4_ENTIV|nr:protein serine/threonine kinase, putative [Entamoeba invadens IP1]ELP95194.1 protein serine/threonine kinase, putative [Entamoeba invadens IP1]|eukprot:XP_004261965.1 protein serine/threonine kinase, putative [Entamoeba invadens IP1]